MRSYDIAVIPGDGIGREVTPAALEVLEAAGRAHGFRLNPTEHPWGCDYFVDTGRMMPVDAVDRPRTTDAIFLGAVGRPDVPDHISLWGLLFVAGAVVLGKRVIPLFQAIRTPTLLAFSTASSEAAYPRILEALPKVGVRRRIVSFVLPLGYSFNLDGSMLYCTFGTMFIMQAHGVHLSVSQQIFMLLLLMVTSKGIAGIPRASLVVIMATLTYFGLPEAWIAIVLGVDHLLDMGRSATNVVGNSVAAAVVAKWEGELDDISETDSPDGQAQPAAV